MSLKPSFKVSVHRQNLKFNASHFIAYPGFRERLHGHNYTCGLTVYGRLGEDGYVIDFGEIKKALKQICSNLNEHILIPMLSDVLKISTNEDNGNIEIICEDGSFFSFPAKDCMKLEIAHSSAEELAEYILNRVLNQLSVAYLIKERGIFKLEISVSEAPGQTASCSKELDHDSISHSK